MAKNKADKPKVIIGIPCQEEVKARTAFSIASTIIASKEVVTEVLMRQSCDVVSSRTGIVRDAIKAGATHLFFVDSDMFFPPETLNTLLKHNKDIVGCLYNRRKFPLEGTHAPLVEQVDPKTGLLRCKYVGTGAMLIKLDVFKKMKEPWFSFGRGKEGELTLGEDAWFCYTAGDAGFEVWADPKIKCGHIGSYIF